MDSLDWDAKFNISSKHRGSLLNLPIGLWTKLMFLTGKVLLYQWILFLNIS